MKRVFAAMLLVVTTALFGCSGDGAAVPATATGQFIDAAVQGLAYESGSQKGVTDGDGSFTYEIGKTVKFTIGGIVLGEAPAKAVMTPIDLSTTANADSATPDVVARVQLLMSLSSTDPADGVITIPSSTHDAAKNMTIDFATDKIAIKIADLPKPWKNGVASEDEAKKHFSETLNSLTLPQGSPAKNRGDQCKSSKECAGNLYCRDTGSRGRRCVGHGEMGDDCAKEDAGTGSNSCNGNLKCRNNGGGAYRCVTGGGGGQGDLCPEAEAGHNSDSCGGSLECRSTGNKIYRCVGRGEQNDLCAETDAGEGSDSCGGNLKCRNTGYSTWHCIGRGQEGDFCSEEESGHGSWNCGGSQACARSGSDYICKVGSTNWMSKIPDTTPITQLTIPGTHDTSTFNYNGVVPFVKTQESRIRKQLDSGIRFLDIRAGVYDDFISHPESYGDLGIYHDFVFLGMFFGDVLDECIKFLDENPTETIFMSVKSDYTGTYLPYIPVLSFQDRFESSYYNDLKYKSYWYDGTTREGCDLNKPKKVTSNTFPNICDVRKSIVLMSRSGLDDTLGIDFHIGDNESACLDITNHAKHDNNDKDPCPDGNLKIDYEDLYSPNTDNDKVKAISDHLTNAQNYLKTNKNKNDTLWVTFTSANKPPKGPEYYAKSGGVPHVDPWLDINGKLMSDMDLDKSSPMGIVAMDFPSWELIRFLIDTNLPFPIPPFDPFRP